MKKNFLILGTIFSLGIIGCGSDSEKAKEVLQRILKLVGIPQQMVVTICQDSNRDNLCSAGELQTKITINKNETLDGILAKLERLSDDTYFLDNYNPDNPILLILEDSQRVTYSGSNGQFGLSFDSSVDGTSFDYNNTEIDKKELSVLQSMIDAKQLNKSDVEAARAMSNVDQFYTLLLEDLATNVNTLGERRLSPKQINDGNIKEMAEELLANGIRDTLPTRMNACNGNQSCIDNILNPLSRELLITEEEADQIVAEQKKEESNNQPATTKKRDRVLVKETDYDNGKLDSITTYQFDNSNRVTGYIEEDYYNNEIISTETCTYSYNSQNKFIGDQCTATNNDQTSETSRSVYIYEGERITEVDSYQNNNLSTKMYVTKWDNNTPKEIVVESYYEGQSSQSTLNLSYADRNPIKMVIKSAQGETTTTKRYDDKETPYDFKMLFGESFYWYAGVNNIVHEETTINYGEIESKATTTTDYKITYDGDYPTKIEKTMTTNYTGGEPYVEKSTTLYEYRKID